MWRKRKQEDFNAEIEAHLQLEADELRSEGLISAEAQAAARRAFGNRTVAQERFYESSRWMFAQHFFRDVRFAARILVKDAKFSVLAILALAIGIGVSTGIFALLGSMFQPHGSNVRSTEEVRNPASYVGLDRGRFRNFSFPEYRYLQDHSTELEAISAESAPYNLVLNGASPGGDAEQVLAASESASSMSILRMRPALGRSFSTGEEQAGTPPVAVLSYRFWQRRFGGNADALGKTLVLNAHDVRIVGVADSKFHENDATAIFLPLGLQPLLLGQGDWLRDSETKWLMVSARLRPGVSMARAQAEADVLGAAFDGNGQPAAGRSTPEHAGQAPQSPDGRILVSSGGVDRQMARLIAGAKTVINLIVAMLLAIACSNLANLLLARAAIRRQEIGVRLSLGASRARLVCQLLTESLLLSIGGGATGLVFSVWLMKAITWLSPTLANLPPGEELHLRNGAFLYALLLSLGTGFAFGLGPALAATKTNLARALHAEGLTGTPSAPTGKMWSPRNLLVVAPLAVSLMLLIGATVLARALSNARTEPKFDASRVIGMTFRLKAQGYDESKSLQFQDSLGRRIATVPGVVSFALASGFPLPWLPPMSPCSLETDSSAASPGGRALCHAVSAGYFETLGLPIIRGRAFLPSDRAGSAPVAIVNEELARTYWPDQEAIGKRIRGGDTFFEVVGVVANVQDLGGQFSFLLLPTIYAPAGQGTLLAKGLDSGGDRMASYQMREMQFYVRAAGETAAVKQALRQAVRATDPSLYVDIQTVEERLEPMTGSQRAMTVCLSGFGVLAMLMACSGIYAILAYAVSRRTREIGIRVTLGAQRFEILSMVMRRTLALIAWGIGLGVLGAFALSRILAATIEQLGGLDAATCISLALLLGAASLLAGYLPSRKALRVDPVQALRCE